MRIFLVVTFSLLLSIVGWSQIDRIEESDIQDEEKFLQALQLRLLEKWDESLELYKELERREPANDVIQFEIAKIYNELKDQSNAIDYAKKASSNDPKKMVYREFLVDQLIKVKDYSQLNEQLEIFIQEGKFDENNYYQMARNYENLGNIKNALKILDKLDKKIGYSKRLGRAKVRLLQKQRNEKQLVRELNKLTDNFPGQVDILLHKAILLHSMNREEEATSTYRELLKYDPDHVGANVYINAIEANAQTKQDFLNSKASIIKNPNVELDEKIKILIPYVSQLDRDEELTKDMLSFMDMIQEMYPDNAKVHALHGDVFFHSNALKKAAYHYSQSIKQTKGVFLVWKNLMLCLDNSSQFEELMEVAEEAVDYYPNQAVCYYYLGKANVEMGDFEEGLDWLDEGLPMSGNNKKLKTEFELIRAFVHLQLKKEAEARSIYNMIDKAFLGNNHAFFLEVRGDFQNLDGLKEDALKSWERSLLIGGNAERLNQKINSSK